MRNLQENAMKASSPLRSKPTKGKIITGSVLNGDHREKEGDKKGHVASYKGRRASVDTAFLGIGKLPLSLSREKSSLSDTSESKLPERRGSYSLPSTKKDKDKREHVTRFSPSKHSESQKSRSPTELKPILKPCARLSLVPSISVEDVSSKQEDKTSHVQDTGRFCYRLPLTQTARKSVSFRDDVVEHRSRRYSSPSLHLEPTSFTLSTPGSKHFNEAMKIQDEGVS